MKTLYIECAMGAAGDMLSAALYELLPEKEKFIEKLNSIGLENVTVNAEKSVKCGIGGTHFSVRINGEEEGHEHHHEHEHEHEHHHEHQHEHEHHHDHEHHHHHSSMNDIEHIVDSLKISDDVKKDVMAVYKQIAEAESHAHGVPVTDIHFHEVGTMDAVADITAVCMLMNELAPDRVIVSPVNVGKGHVHCAHGILPVPAPATAHILMGVPTYSGHISGELCTPTGAALLKHFADKFGDMPAMAVSAIGYGMGKKDFEAANCVRAFIGEENTSDDNMYEICCNVDDMTAEAIAYAVNKLFTVCNDVYTVPVGMKKSRMGTMICALCSGENREAAVRLMLRHTSTIGVRERVIKRYIMDRTIETEETVFGNVRKKCSAGYGAEKSKYEFDDISRIADENDMSIDEVFRIIKEEK